MSKLVTPESFMHPDATLLYMRGGPAKIVQGSCALPLLLSSDAPARLVGCKRPRRWVVRPCNGTTCPRGCTSRGASDADKMLIAGLGSPAALRPQKRGPSEMRLPCAGFAGVPGHRSACRCAAGRFVFPVGCVTVHRWSVVCRPARLAALAAGAHTGTATSPL